MRKSIMYTFAAGMLAFAACNNASENKTDAGTPPVVDTTAIATTPAPDEPAMDSATMMKKWMEYMTPGEQHKQMAGCSGKWTTEISSWMGADKPPTISKGYTDIKMIYGGRYQQGTYGGEMMGQPFEGTSTMAYDNGKKVFISTWIDNMGTGLMVMEGTWDDGSKSFNLKGKCVDPTTGKDMECREVMKMVDDKNMTMEMYINEKGKEVKTMEIKYVKK